MNVPELEADLGMMVYASDTRGINGEIRRVPEDFIVEEVLIDGSKASIEPFDKTLPPSGHGRYVICLLVKKGWDTLAAVRKIAVKIGVDPERINIAGMKDAKALTAQYISIGTVPLERLFEARLKGLTVNPIRFSPEKISSRLLFGNQFRIAVKSVKYRFGTVQKRIQETRSELMVFGGIPNFFGHQRFGTVRPLSHRVGRYLVKENFEEAAFIFLSEPSYHENPKAREARKGLRETRDFRSALKCFPRNLMYERLMLGHLAKYPRDFLGAFRRIPQNLRLFLVQAYQSFLFNKFLSERMRREIPVNEAQIGDYVVDLDARGLPTTNFKKTEGTAISAINRMIVEGRMVVAIPLVGPKQPVSDGLQGELEKEVLEEEGACPNDFRIDKMPEASAAGGLRTTLAKILDLNITVKDEQAEGNGLCANFSFTLHKDSYATVLLREFMKPKDLIKAGF